MVLQVSTQVIPIQKTDEFVVLCIQSCTHAPLNIFFATSEKTSYLQKLAHVASNTQSGPKIK